MTEFLIRLENWMLQNVGPSDALVVVDVQPDFMSGGKLPVAEAEKILPGIRVLIEKRAFDVCVATQDWHPPEHVSFASNHPATSAFETIELHGHRQTLWPDHCVQGSEGARLLPGLPWAQMDLILRKGMDPRVDSYSGFRENWDARGIRRPTGLAGYLREREVKNVYICGLARDVCCKWTVEDAASSGFQSHILWDLTRPVVPGSNDRNREEMLEGGVGVVEFFREQTVKR